MAPPQSVILSGAAAPYLHLKDVWRHPKGSARQILLAYRDEESRRQPPCVILSGAAKRSLLTTGALRHPKGSARQAFAASAVRHHGSEQFSPYLTLKLCCISQPAASFPPTTAAPMPAKGRYFVYMLSSIGRVLYTGVTNDLVQRVWRHKQKVNPGSFTARYNVTRLVYFEEYREIRAAIEREKQLKACPRRKREQLISKSNPEWKDLSAEPGFNRPI